MIQESVTWQLMSRDLHQVIAKDFADMQHYSRIFSSYFPTFDHTINYSAEAFANQVSPIPYTLNPKP